MPEWVQAKWTFEVEILEICTENDLLLCRFKANFSVHVIELKGGTQKPNNFPSD